MSVYVIAQGRIENREMLDRYVAKVLPSLQAHGARVLAFDETPHVVEGEVPYPRTVIIEFADRDAFDAWYASDEYQAILPLRLESTPGSLFVVNGLPPA
jgi:uncharacterized protein (DUF1330 family)